MTPREFMEIIRAVPASSGTSPDAIMITPPVRRWPPEITAPAIPVTDMIVPTPARMDSWPIVPRVTTAIRTPSMKLTGVIRRPMMPR